MILVLIDNYEFLCRIISYLDSAGILYTTNPDDKYDYILLAEMDNKMFISLNQNTKRIIFFTHLEENNILENNNNLSKKSIKYNEKLKSFLKNCHTVVVSMPFFKRTLSKICNSKIVIVENEVFEQPKKVYRMRKNNILVIDFDYDNLDHIFKIADTYSKFTIYLMGYKPSYLLGKRKKKLMSTIPKNVVLIKKYDLNILSENIIRCNYVIYYHDKFINYKYLNYILASKKQLLVKNSKVYDNYLINSKNVYLFNDDLELDKKINKIIEGRYAHLGLNAYLLVKDNNYLKTTKKIKEILE